MSRLANVGRGMMSSIGGGGGGRGGSSRGGGSDVPGAAMLRSSRAAGFVAFFNLDPRTRAYRKSQMDKEGIEKQRLKARKGGFHKYTEFNAVTESEPGEPGFSSEAMRFDTDTVGEEQRRRQQALASYNSLIQARSNKSVAREERRFKQMEETKRLEEEKYTRYRADPLMGKKNMSGVPYHPVTLQYNDGDDGRRMAYEDAKIRFRALRRARHMDDKSRSVNYNVVSGKSAARLPTPVDPGPVPDYAYAEHSKYV